MKNVRRLAHQNIDAVIAEYQSGATLTTIADRYHTSHSVISKLLRENGVELRPRPRRLGRDNPGYHRVTVPCDFCGKPVAQIPSVLRRTKHTFCDQECYGKWSSATKVGENHHRYNRTNVNCAQCSAVLLLQPNEIRDRNFCDVTCHGAWKTIHNTGQNNVSFKGGNDEYRGPSWRRARRAARQRDNNTCQRCGKCRAELRRALDVHHKVPFSHFGVARHEEANDLLNLICYCATCHKWVETHETPLYLQSLGLLPEVQGSQP